MFANVNDYLLSVKITYREEMISILDFWLKYGMDWEKGGIITYCNRDGSRWDDHKSGWFQGRALFAFSKGYNDILKKPEYLEAAHNLYKFLCEHNYVQGDPHGKMVYLMDRDGNMLNIQPSLHSEAFALMGISEYYKATGNPEALDRVRRLFDDTLMFYFDNPRYIPEGVLSDPDKRDYPELAWYMSLLCATQTLRGCDPDPERKALYTRRLTQYIEEVIKLFYDYERGMILERQYDPPGHTCEILWFATAEGMYQGRQDWIDLFSYAGKKLFEQSYDHVNGGLPLLHSFYGDPPRKENWNVRRWWVQNELLLMLMYGYVGTKDEWFLEKYRDVHEYVFSHFPDREYGEWYGYIGADGLPIADLKGDDQKGPYHLPRHFVSIYNLIDAMGI